MNTETITLNSVTDKDKFDYYHDCFNKGLIIINDERIISCELTADLVGVNAEFTIIKEQHMSLEDEVHELAERFNTDKPQISLLFDMPEAIEGIVRVLEFGMNKYSRCNFKKGLTYLSVIDSMSRHMLKFQSGEDLDLNEHGETDINHSGLSHVDHIACNAMFLSYFFHTNKGREINLDDRIIMVDLLKKRLEHTEK